ncbi:MAG: SH3 domain-containing protein [Halarcobacter sp.]
MKKLGISFLACTVILLTGCSTTNNNLAVNKMSQQQASLHAKAINKVINHAKGNSSEIIKLTKDVNNNNQAINMLEEKYHSLIAELKVLKEKLFESNHATSTIVFKKNHQNNALQKDSTNNDKKEIGNPNAIKEVTTQKSMNIDKQNNLLKKIENDAAIEKVEVQSIQENNDARVNIKETIPENLEMVSILISNVFLRQSADENSQKIDVLRANRIVKVIDDTHPTMAKIDYFNGYIAKNRIATIKKTILDNKLPIKNHFISLKKLLVKSSFVDGSTTMDVIEKDKEVYVDYVINGKAYLKNYKGFVNFSEQTLMAVNKEK